MMKKIIHDGREEGFFLLFLFTGEGDVRRDGDDTCFAADVFENAVGRSREDFSAKTAHELHFTPWRFLSDRHFCRQKIPGCF